MSEPRTPITGELLSESDVGLGSIGSQPVGRMYHIFHAYNPQFVFTEKEKQPRKYVGFVIATSIEDAFKQAQPEFNPEYAKYQQRPTAIGDLIQDDYGFYMVCSVGFKLVCLVDDEGAE